MKHDHSPDGIRMRLAAPHRPSYLRDWIFGGIDGSVTTFAVVSGVIGARLPPGLIVILGVANLLGDRFSMAASNYSATRTEREELETIRHREGKHIDEFPAGEREEVRQIFAAKGLGGDDLERVVTTVTADRELWIRTMLTDEYGLSHNLRAPLAAALSTFLAFFVCGAVPLLPFIVSSPHAAVVSMVSTAVVFFSIGSAKSLWLSVPWWRSGMVDPPDRIYCCRARLWRGRHPEGRRRVILVTYACNAGHHSFQSPEVG